jgi:hypothetical protein
MFSPVLSLSLAAAAYGWPSCAYDACACSSSTFCASEYSACRAEVQPVEQDPLPPKHPTKLDHPGPGSQTRPNTNVLTWACCSPARLPNPYDTDVLAAPNPIQTKMQAMLAVQVQHLSETKAKLYGKLYVRNARNKK